MFFPRKAYFRTVIDYHWKAKQEGYRLVLGPPGDRNPKAQIILEETRRIIIDELPNEFKKAYNIRIRTKITHESEGSLVVIVCATFTFLLGLYHFIASYPDFKDGCQALREDLQRLLNKMLERYSSDLEAKVTLLAPRDIEFIGDFPTRYVGFTIGGSNFFWPMILSLLINVALIAIIILLVWKAVAKVYFAV